MKSFKTYISISILIAVAAISCTELDETLYSSVRTSEYGKTSSEIQTIVGGAYASLRGGSDDVVNYFPCSEYVFFLDEISSDEATIPTRGTDWYDNGRYQELQRHTWDAENLAILSAWRYAYEGIASVNGVIYQVNQSGLDEEETRNIMAELRGLRAYYYLRLLDWFGAVPITVNFEETELPEKSSRDSVYRFVESELTDILPDLPVAISHGRLTETVAYALLARLYINSEVYIGQPRWQDAIDACDMVVGYQLEPDYFTNFLVENQVSNEIIFAIPYDHEEGTLGNYMNSMSFHYNQRFAFSATGNWPWSGNGMCGQPSLYGYFEETDARRNAMRIGSQINKATGNVVLMDNGNPLIYTEEITNFEDAPQNEGVRLNKYEVDPEAEWERDHDFVVMRYAEVLMIKAEALVRQGAPGLAGPLVEQIRERAGLDTPANITLDFLEDEWLREFVFEGLRRTTNIRFGSFFEPWWEKGATPKYRGVFPIPQQALELNENLEQNPDYLN